MIFYPCMLIQILFPSAQTDKIKQKEAVMYYFVVNPNARSGMGLNIWKKIQKELKSQQVSHKVFFTGPSLNASDAVRSICREETDCTIILLGGDGTVNEAIQGLLHPETVTLGYIPIGSGNDFARDYRLPTDPMQALQNILHPVNRISMDICRVRTAGQTQLFAGSSGMGFDAAVCMEALDSPIKHTLNRIKLGKFTYIGIALHQIFSFSPKPICVLFDGNEKVRFRKAYFVCAMNHPYEGGGLMLAPGADGQDGCLDVCVVSGLPKALLLILLPTAFFGKHVLFRRYITFRRCRRVSIHSSSPLPVHTDGEAFGMHTSVTAGTTGQQVTIIAGPSFGEPALGQNSKGFRKISKESVN